MAMDWTKQAEDMVKSWTDAQQKMWDSWLSTVQSMNVYSGGDSWEKAVATWQDSVKGALETQSTWTKFWAESVASSAGSSKQMVEWSEQTQEMTKRWTEAQTKLWDSWFDALRKADPATMAKAWDPEEMKKAFQTWQDASRTMMEAQMDMVRLWTSIASQQDK